MRVVRTAAELDAALDRTRSIGLVPTMGALHRGHTSLMALARERCDQLVVSIFVNPLQFDQAADLDAYPRTLDADLDACRAAEVDVVLAPEVSEVYPDGEPVVRLSPGSLGDDLEGASRPGHFAGMLTVVAKLFGLVRPDLAVFGEKDYQQLAIVRRMVTDLSMAVEVIGGETVREPDGLALSSRNVRLGEGERQHALALSQALRAGAAAGPQGADAVVSAARQVLDVAPGVDVDYLELRSVALGPAPDRGPARLLVAAQVGPVRLIDNLAVDLGEAP